MYKVTVHTEFNAAHRLRDYKGKCESLHGHNWAVELTAGASDLNSTGMVLDFTELKKALLEHLDVLDHKFLNEIEPFLEVNPTSENICKFIYEGMKDYCTEQKVKLIKVTVWETPTSSASYEE